VGNLFHLETISLHAEAFEFHVVPFVNSFSWLLSHLSSIEEVIAFVYQFQYIPCSFLY
jgi:hypothetical protein